MSKESKQVERSQYHHYIPRFVLRNFEEKNSLRTQEARGFYGTIKNRDGLIRYYDLEQRDLGFRLISNAYGVTDMYRDAKLPDTMYIEKALSKLEGQAANVIRKLLNAQKDGQKSVSLSGKDLHVLRRFLYVMQYRTRIIREKYQCSIDEYKGTDKEELKEHMRRHNFQTPNDVWLETLRLILDAPETANSEGYNALKGKMYDGDYKELKHNLDNFYVCLCEPESDADEFIMTDTGFAVTEGRDLVEELKSIGLQSFAEKVFSKRFPFTEYHKIAVISPRLAIVLRNSIFRDLELNRILKNQIYSFLGPSTFDDLPVKPATATYVNPLETRKEALESTIQLPDGSFQTFASVQAYRYSMEDTYEFGIYPIPTKDVLFLSTMQISKVQDAITFRSDKAMLASLDQAIKSTNLKNIPLSVLARQEQAGSVSARRLASKLQLSALLENLTDGKNRENVSPGLFSFSRFAETIADQLKGTSYIILANGSIDMFSWDLQEAQKAENERGKIHSTFGHLPKHEIEKKLRENSQRILEELSTRTLLLTTRLNHALEIPDMKKWLVPTPAEKCVMKLWGKITDLEFKRLLVGVIWKENYRSMACPGIRQAIKGQKWQMERQMRRMEDYVSDEWGSAIEWAKQTNRYDALLSLRLLLTQMSLSPAAAKTDDESEAELDFRVFLRRFLFCVDHPVLKAPLATAFPDLFARDTAAAWREVLLVWLFPVVDAEWVEARWVGRNPGPEDLKAFAKTVKGRK